MNARPDTKSGINAARTAHRASRLQHDERFDALRTPRVRRGLVVASFLLWLSSTIVLAGWDFENLFLVLGVLTISGALLLNRTVRLVADAPDQALDERLVAVRNAAYRTSYRVLVVVTGLALFAVSLVETLGWFDLQGHHLRALLWGFLGVAILLPSAVLAWREREV